MPMYLCSVVAAGRHPRLDVSAWLLIMAAEQFLEATGKSIPLSPEYRDGP
ncbi:MAG: hypothetical protein MUD05_03215 [Candidatus Nanopelagicales bacterium]|jgi:hypothetical protein|nr:hypothetical protein [Candidatus Nanopelagicales bacterium]